MAFRDIRKSRKWLSGEEVRLLMVVLAVLIALLALNIYLAQQFPGGGQLFLRWSGARAFLFESVEPYSTTVAERTQDLVYGRRASAGEYPYVLNDPFPIVLLYIPLAGLREAVGFFLPSVGRSIDFPVVHGIWMLFSEIALAWLVYSFLRALEWEPPRWLFALIMVSSLLGYYSLNAFASGTPSVFLAVLFFAILYALRSFSDELAGALLFLTAYQWEVGALFFLFILVFVAVNRRWRVLYGFGMALAVLMAVSFLAYPAWGLPYVRGVLSDWYRSGNLTFGHVASQWFPQGGSFIDLWLVLVLGVILFLEWLGAANSHFRRIAWTACLSLAVTPLMGFAILPSNHVVLVPSLVLILMLIWERWTRWKVWLTLAVLLLSFLVPFWLYSQVLAGVAQPYSDLLTVLPPLAAIFGLYWMRWWAVRSPRIWVDQIGGRK